MKYRINNVNTNPRIPMGIGNNESSTINRIYGGQICFAFYLDLSAFRSGDKVESLKIKLRIRPFDTSSLSFIMKAKQVEGTYIHGNANSDSGQTIDEVAIQTSCETELTFEITNYIQEKIDNNETFAIINFYHNCVEQFELIIDTEDVEIKDIQDIILEGYAYKEANLFLKNQTISNSIGGAVVNFYYPLSLINIHLPCLSSDSKFLPIPFEMSYSKRFYNTTFDTYGVAGKGFSLSYIYKIRKIYKAHEEGRTYSNPITLDAFELENYQNIKTIYRKLSIEQEVEPGEKIIVDRYLDQNRNIIYVTFNEEDYKYYVIIKYFDGGQLEFKPIDILEETQELKISSYLKNGFISEYNYTDDKLVSIVVYNIQDKTKEIDRINISYNNNLINEIDYVNFNKIIKLTYSENKLSSYQIYNKTDQQLTTNDKIIYLSLFYDQYDNIIKIKDEIENKYLYITYETNQITLSEKQDILSGKFIKILKNELEDKYIIENELNQTSEYEFDYLNNLIEKKDYIKYQEEINDQDIEIQTGRYIENYNIDEKIVNKVIVNSHLNLLNDSSFKLNNDTNLIIINKNNIVTLQPNDFVQQTINIDNNINKEDEIYFGIRLNGNLTVNNYLKVNINFSYSDQNEVEEEIYIIDKPCFKYFNHNENKFQKIIGSVKLKDSYSNITIVIKNEGYENIQLSEIQLYKGLGNNYYGFNEFEQVTDVVTSSQETNYIYDEKGKIKTIISDTGIFDYQYNEKSQIIKISKRASLAYEEYEYHNYGNIKNKKTVTENQKEVKNEYYYDEKNNLIKQIDNLDNKIEYSYDNYLNLKDTIYPNNLKNINEYYINDLLKIQKKEFEILYENDQSETKTIDKVDYEYDSIKTRLIKKIKVNDDIEYIYNYDENENLLTVYYRQSNINSLLFVCTYKIINNIKTNLLETKKYYSNTSFEEYAFEYDEKYRISQITYVKNYYNNTSEPESHIILFVYDNLNRLYRTYKNNILHLEYIYDENNRLKQCINHQNENTTIEQYEYDNLSKIQSTSLKINDDENTYYYDYPFESQTDNFYGFLMRISKYNLNDSYIANENKKSFYGALDNGNLVLYPYNENIKMRLLRIQGSDTKRYIEFNYNDLNKERIDNNVYGNLVYNKANQTKDEISVYLFMKELNSYSHKLITFLDLSENEITKVYSEYGNICINNTVELQLEEGWNLVAVVIKNDKIKLSINGRYYNEITTDIDISSISKIRIGDKNSNDYITDIAYINIGNNSFNEKTLSQIYEEGIRYLNNEYIAPFSGVRYYNRKTYQKFDIFSLNGTLKSLSGVEPYQYLYNDNFNKSTKQKIFKYDEELNRYIYGSYSSSLAASQDILLYNMKLPISGTLTIRFKSENILGTRNILIVESINKKIRLFINSNNKLVADINGNINIIGCIVRHNRWNTLFITYSEDGVKVKLNNYKLASIIEDNMLLENNMKYNIYLGCYINNLNEPVDHLNGKLEMFGYSAYILPETEMDDIIQKGGLFGVSKKYDETSRLTENRIATPDNVLLTKYRYNDKTKLNPYIVSEELPTEEENIYEYDNMGNIIKILTLKKELYSFLLNTDTNYDSRFFIKGIEYKYDEFNRLQNEKHYSSTEEISKEINYEYNSFGNIISKTINNEKYNYNYTNYLLTSVEKEATEEEIYKIEYDRMYPFKITRNNITYELSWKQNQLIKYGDITFEYNEEGERTKKITPNKTIEYIYSNGKIVSSKNNNTIIDYHYDESGLLVGLTYNNKQYFYIRDILGNIIMIIDKDGNHMVKYSYDGYGKPTISTYGSVGSPLASNNIFLYKGYCYDVETQLFYCNSRYYSPELCRWISPDDIEYLDPESVNGLNLYCYCLNNPISYADPSGCLAISAFIMGAIIGLAVESAVDYFEDDSRTIDHSFLDYFGAGVGGAISGGFGASTNLLFRLGGAVLGSVAQGAIAENVDYNPGSLKRDLIIGIASFGISEGITIIGKKFLRGWFNKVASNTTKKASKQLHQFANGRIVNNLKPNAQKILGRANLYGNILSFGEKSVGALYSFITSMSHSTIINW